MNTKTERFVLGPFELIPHVHGKNPDNLRRSGLWALPGGFATDEATLYRIAHRNGWKACIKNATPETA